jgi:hypothetical protein
MPRFNIEIVLKELRNGNADAFKEFFCYYFKEVFDYSLNIIPGHKSISKKISTHTLLFVWGNRLKWQSLGQIATEMRAVTTQQALLLKTTPCNSQFDLDLGKYTPGLPVKTMQELFHYADSVENSTTDIIDPKILYELSMVEPPLINKGETDKKIDDQDYTFEKIFPHLIIDLRNFATSFLSDALSANNIAAEAFIKLYILFGEFSSTESMRSFLFTSVRDNCCDYLRFKSANPQTPVYKISEAFLEKVPSGFVDKMFSLLK